MASVSLLIFTVLSGYFYDTNALSCYSCINTLVNTSRVAYSKMFTLPDVGSSAISNNCIDSLANINTIDNNCTNVCFTSLSNNTEKQWFALRGCADTMISSDQWKSLNTKPETQSENCYVSATSSSSSAVPANSKFCFCKSDKCNKQLYADMVEKSPGNKLQIYKPYIIFGLLVCLFVLKLFY